MALSQQHFWGQVVRGPTYCPVGQSTRSEHALHPLTDSLPLLQALGFSLQPCPPHSILLFVAQSPPPSTKSPIQAPSSPAHRNQEQLLLGSCWEEPVPELRRNRAFVSQPVQPARQPGRHNSNSQHIVLPDGCKLTHGGATKPPAPLPCPQLEQESLPHPRKGPQGFLSEAQEGPLAPPLSWEATGERRVKPWRILEQDTYFFFWSETSWQAASPKSPTFSSMFSLMKKLPASQG